VNSVIGSIISSTPLRRFHKNSRKPKTPTTAKIPNEAPRAGASEFVFWSAAFAPPPPPTGSKTTINESETLNEFDGVNGFEPVK
jgi:hypothetical protein